MRTREESNEDWELGLNLSDQKEVRTQQGYEGTWGFAPFSGVLRSFVSAYVRSYEGALFTTSDRTTAKCFLSPTHGLKVPIAGNLISPYIIYNTVLYYNIYCI